MTGRRLENRVAWISGAASGMGAATARLFAREGARVTVADVNVEGARAVADEINSGDSGRALAIRCDVSRQEEVERSISATVDRFGGLQIVVNNAAIGQYDPLHECLEKEWDAVMAVNVKAAYFSFRSAYPHLRRVNPSYVVNVASVSSFVAQAATPVYTVSKHALLGLTRTIALDYAAEGIHCNCVCPGITDTPGLRRHLDQYPDPEKKLKERLRRVPLGKVLLPEQMARAILYLSCQDSAGITGTSLVVDGGYTTAAEWDSRA